MPDGVSFSVEQKPLAIIAGGGDLPWLIIDYCRQHGRRFLVVTFSEQDYDREFVDMQHRRFSLGAMRQYVDYLKSMEVDEIILSGHMQRPNLWALRPDSLAAKVIMKLTRRAMGDNAFLQCIIVELEKFTGARIIGYEDLLGRLEWDLGFMGRHQPRQDDFHNMARAEEVFAALSACDVGQSLVVQGGLVIGVEAIEGTDALLQRSASLLRKGMRGLLFKKMKPLQTRRADLPTIGVKTIEGIRSAGLDGLVIGQSGVIILDREEVLSKANAYGIFIYVIP